MQPDYSVPHSAGGRPPDDPDQHLACILRHLLDAVAGMERLHRSHLQRLDELEQGLRLLADRVLEERPAEWAYGGPCPTAAASPNACDHAIPTLVQRAEAKWAWAETRASRSPYLSSSERIIQPPAGCEDVGP